MTRRFRDGGFHPPYDCAAPPPLTVMTSLVPVIHDFLPLPAGKTWMAGASPAMTMQKGTDTFIQKYNPASPSFLPGLPYVQAIPTFVQ